MQLPPLQRDCMRKLCFILFALVPLLAFTVESVKSDDDLKIRSFSPFKKQKSHKDRNKGAGGTQGNQNQAATGDPIFFNDTLVAVMTIPAGLFLETPPPPSGFCCVKPPTLTPVIVTPDGRILRGESITVGSLSTTDPTALTFRGVNIPSAGIYTLYLILDTNGTSVTIMTQGPIPSSLPVQITSSRGIVPQCTVVVPVFSIAPPNSPPITEQYQWGAVYLYNPIGHSEALADRRLVKDLLAQDSGAQ